MRKWLSNLFGYADRKQLRATTEGPWYMSDPALADWFGYRSNTASGQSVNEETAKNLSAVYAAVRILACTSAYLPIRILKRLENGDRQEQREHPAWKLLHSAEPNPDQVLFMFRAAFKSRVLLWGNGYAEIERTNGGEPIALWPIHPRRVRPERANRGRIFYEVGDDTDEQRPTSRSVIPAADMLHIPNLPPGCDGFVGKSTIHYARESLGLAMGAERTGAAFYGNSMRPGGILTHTGELSETAAKKLKHRMEAYTGPNNSGKTLVLEEGMDFKQQMIPPEDAQFLETREFQEEEIARWFGVPPHMLALLKRATFSNIEHQGIEFVVYSLTPWLTLEAQEYKKKLLREDEKPDHYVEHVVKALLRGDVSQRYAAYATARQWGWMSVNDVLRTEDENGIGEDGDKYLTPSNMMPAGTEQPPPMKTLPAPGQQPPPREPVDDEDEDEEKERTRAAIRGVLEEALTRMARLEANAAITAAKKPEAFLTWIDEHIAGHARRFLEAIAPAASACRAIGVDVDTGALYAAWSTQTREALLNLSGSVNAEKLPSAVVSHVGAWTDGRIIRELNRIFGGNSHDNGKAA